MPNVAKFKNRTVGTCFCRSTAPLGGITCCWDRDRDWEFPQSERRRLDGFGDSAEVDGNVTAGRAAAAIAGFAGWEGDCGDGRGIGV